MPRMLLRMSHRSEFRARMKKVAFARVVEFSCKRFAVSRFGCDAFRLPNPVQDESVIWRLTENAAESSGSIASTVPTPASAAAWPSLTLADKGMPSEPSPSLVRNELIRFEYASEWCTAEKWDRTATTATSARMALKGGRRNSGRVDMVRSSFSRAAAQAVAGGRESEFLGDFGAVMRKALATTPGAHTQILQSTL